MAAKGCESRAAGGCRRVLRGERGAETTAARECCKGSAKQTDGLEGEQARLAGLCMQRDSGGEQNSR